MSFLFMNAQYSGVMPATNRVPWRGNSDVNDLIVGGALAAGPAVPHAEHCCPQQCIGAVARDVAESTVVRLIRCCCCMPAAQRPGLPHVRWPSVALRYWQRPGPCVPPTCAGLSLIIR